MFVRRGVQIFLVWHRILILNKQTKCQWRQSTRQHIPKEKPPQRTAHMLRGCVGNWAALNLPCHSQAWECHPRKMAWLSKGVILFFFIEELLNKMLYCLQIHNICELKHLAIKWMSTCLPTHIKKCIITTTETPVTSLSLPGISTITIVRLSFSCFWKTSFPWVWTIGKWNHTDLFFHELLFFKFNIVFVRYVQVDTCNILDSYSLLFLILLYEYSKTYLPILLLMTIWMCPFFFFVITNHVAMNSNPI